MTTLAVDSMFNTMDMLRRQREGDFDAERKRKKAKWDDEDRDLKMEEVARAKTLRTDLETAAKPLEVAPGVEQTALDDDGNAMPANPAQFQVAGKFYGDRTAADKAAADPKAQVARMSDVLRKHARPEAAMDLQTKQTAFEGNQRTAENAVYADDLKKSVPFGDWSAAAQFMNRSGDPNVTGEFVPSPDGTKQVMMVRQPDGSVKAAGEFDNTPEGFTDLMFRLERAGADTMSRHLDRKQGRAETKRYHDAQMARMEESVKLQREGLELRRNRAGGGAGGGGGGADGDALNNEGRFNITKVDEALEPLFEVKDADGNKTTNPLGLQFTRALALHMPEAQIGDARGAALNAFNRYQESLAANAGDHGKAVSEIEKKLAIERDMAASGAKDAVTNINGRSGVIGNPVAAKAPAPAAVASPSAAMREYQAAEQAKREAQAAREKVGREREAATQAEANALTRAQIAAMTPQEARKAQRRFAGLLPARVMRDIELRTMDRPLGN